MPFEVLSEEPVDRTIRDEVRTVSSLEFAQIQVFICTDGSCWASQRLAQAWSEDHCDGSAVAEEIGFTVKRHTRYPRVWTHNGFRDLLLEYEPRESQERVRQRALAKLDAEEIQALGLDSTPQCRACGWSPSPETEKLSQPLPSVWGHLDE